jgi:hypothetical protein
MEGLVISAGGFSLLWVSCGLAFAFFREDHTLLCGGLQPHQLMAVFQTTDTAKPQP